jgi:hypothetical protein
VEKENEEEEAEEEEEEEEKRQNGSIVWCLKKTRFVILWPPLLVLEGSAKEPERSGIPYSLSPSSRL